VSLPTVPDVKAARLSACQYTERFADAGNPLTPAQALVEAERCLYCHDAPCTTADRKSTRLNSSHDQISTLSLHYALPI